MVKDCLTGGPTVRYANGRGSARGSLPALSLTGRSCLPSLRHVAQDTPENHLVLRGLVRRSFRGGRRIALPAWLRTRRGGRAAIFVDGGDRAGHRARPWRRCDSPPVSEKGPSPNPGGTVSDLPAFFLRFLCGGTGGLCGRLGPGTRLVGTDLSGTAADDGRVVPSAGASARLNPLASVLRCCRGPRPLRDAPACAI